MQVSTKTDVYGFGMLVKELLQNAYRTCSNDRSSPNRGMFNVALCMGRVNIALPAQARVDSETDCQSFTCMARHLMPVCLQWDVKDRGDMGDVMHMIDDFGQ